MSHNSLKWSVVIDWASLVASVVKNLPVKAGNISSIPGSERSPGERNGYSLQYSCLGNPMDRGACQAIVHGVARVRHDLVTKPPPPGELVLCNSVYSTWADRLRGGVCGGWGTGAEVGGGLSFL